MSSGASGGRGHGPGEAWRTLGDPVEGGVLLIGDHASNMVPEDIELGIDPALLDAHIALDIGVSAVAERLVAAGAVDAAILGGVSRLVVDCNRDPDAAGIIPLVSDGHKIPGNAITDAARRARIQRFYAPYHGNITATIAAYRPIMFLSLHSFTPALASEPGTLRPWQIGILYNNDRRLAQIAIPAFEAEGLIVGDQLPYSGRQLNTTMNRHAEDNLIPYLGVEMRQDMVLDSIGQRRLTDMIGRVVTSCRHHLAQKSMVGQSA